MVLTLSMKIFNKKSHLTQTVELKLNTRAYEKNLLFTRCRARALTIDLLHTEWAG